jgi:hypothetical protein
MGRREGKSKSENNDEEVETKRPRNDESEDHEDSEEEDEEIEAEDLHAFVLAPDGVSQYIVRRYTDDMEGRDIPEELTVRSRNRRLFSEIEAYDFWEKSTAICPTYGVCLWCFGSGPTNMYCQVCKNVERTYKILLTNNRVIIDAEYVSMFFGTTHLIAKADRTHHLMNPESQVIKMDIVKLFVHERWHGRDKPALYRIGTWELFELGLTWNCHPQCRRPRGDEIVQILIIEDWYNGEE